MKAKEELIKLILDNDFITAPRLRSEFRSLLDRVEIEAQAEFKNCNIPHVSNNGVALPEYTLAFCEKCYQMTNHVCQKCKGNSGNDC